MRKDLPEFEGREVQASIARFSGRTAQRVGAFAEGEFAFVITKVRTGRISHADFKAASGANSPKLYSRIHYMATTRAIILDEEAGAALFEAAMKEADKAYGIQGLPFGQNSDDDTDDESVND